ncbi:hypothetical protein RRU01S_15_00690 [Agrobacterium rubi TR3 = NBRC 13261]|uniref:Uncharacterized protein n=1 Tax=Agrobacterium rubi TR3 = NBRC 13261 TaxID=1368415 RepID=A0A081CWU8_9HYPH|nr:hypothetical protein RRU01S_15_00690 [Agrobacterium rubi TR3 = NBRC 13261]
MQAKRAKPAPVLDPSMANPSLSFATFLKDREANFTLPENLHWVGIELETDLTADVPKLERSEEWQEMGLEVNSLTVATAMVEIMIDAAKELSTLINTYKLEEIDRLMENASLVKRAQLEALKTRLARKTSHFFPVID